MFLRDIIIEEIKTRGPISFHDYMERCLYHPTLGYYTSATPRIGPRGDFYTSPNLGSLFGILLANQLEEMWQLLGKKEFVIVEYGAGTGLLCRDIMRAIEGKKAFRKNVQYFVIEKNNQVLAQQVPQSVTRLNNLEELKPFSGCIISNELVDNFPVHRVVQQHQLMELFVDNHHGIFREIEVPAEESLTNYLRELDVTLPPGYHTEINIRAIEWIKQVSERLSKGYVLTIDYGYPSHELYDRIHSGGNILCYHQHRINSSPYENIGEQDITSHINFSALDHWGQKHRLTLNGFTTQARFLMSLGLTREVIRDPACVGSPLMLRTLLVDMGNRLKVLAQQKEMGRQPLSGFRFPAPI